MMTSRTRKTKQKKAVYFLAGDAQTFNLNTPILRSKLSMQTFTMTFLFPGSEIVPPVGVTSYVGQSFALNQVPNITNWTINFDKFRLNWVEIVYSPSRTQINGGSNLTPKMYCAPDFDSDATPTSIAEVLRHPRAVTVPFTTGFKRKFCPRIAKTIYKTGLSSSYGEGDAYTWVDCANADTPHFGYMWAADPQSSANQFGYSVNYAYNVTFQAPIA